MNDLVPNPQQKTVSTQQDTSRDNLSLMLQKTAFTGAQKESDLAFIPQNRNSNSSIQQQDAACSLHPRPSCYPVLQCQKPQTAAITYTMFSVSNIHACQNLQINSNTDTKKRIERQTFRGRGASLLEPMVFNIPGSKLDRTTCGRISSIYMSASTQRTISLHNHSKCNPGRPGIVIEYSYTNLLFRNSPQNLHPLGCQ